MFNNSDDVIEDWYISMTFENAISNIWNAEVVAQNNNSYVIKNVGWNQDIPIGGSIQFGIEGNESFLGFPSAFTLLGNPVETDDELYEIEWLVNDSWGEGFTGSILITNKGQSVIEDWVLEFDYDKEFDGIWNASLLSHEDGHFIIKNADYNANIMPNQTISVGFNVRGTDTGEMPENYSLHSYVLYSGDSMELDTDEDGIVDGVETIWGLNYQKPDTDEDGLSDYEELYVTMTNPLEPDTDQNGVGDAQDDIDGDGISNIDELRYGTNPINSDSDRDDLTDYEELFVYATNPNDEDMDDDGLYDSDEIILGLNPNDPDTDHDGIGDAEERFWQVVEADFGEEGRGVDKVSIGIEMSGNANSKVVITNTYEWDWLSRGAVGLFGVPVELYTETNFDHATISFHYDESQLGDTKEEDLLMLWYDEENGIYQVLDDCVIDAINNTVTYDTTHFSTYLLVDSVKWFNAWKLDLDYRNYKEDEPVVNYEIVFICDASGSMKGSRIAAAKTAIYHFVDAMGANDEAAIVKFNGSAYVNCDFTDDKQTLKNGIDAITASGKTNVNSGLTKAFSLFENHSSEKKKVAILLCDGDVNYNQSTINSFKEAEIPIYSINLISSYSHYYLQKMADETGGEYYYAFSEDELQNCFVFIQDKTVDASDQTDTDEDGLIDAYELVGMRMPNGDIVVTDPENKYSDKDGLTDFEEVGIPYEINYVYKGKALITGATYFKVRSNPRDEDTDDDGMLDHMDIYPWRPTYRIAAKLNNRFQDVEYLNICENTGAEVKEYHGGNQDWWLAKSEVPFTKDIDYHYCDIDTNYRLAKCGCGIIAVNDFEVYLFQQNTGFSAVNGASPVVYDEKTGAIQKEVYEGYVENNWITQRYTIRDRDWFNYSVGLFPFDMECGIKDFLKHNHSNYNNVEWAPFCFKANSIQKELVLSEIIRLLNKNTPVICAYHNPDNPLMMYAEIDDAKLNLSTDELDTKYGMYHGKSNKISSHYMTIIGVQEYIDSDSNRTEYLLEIESWGKIFYIRYDQYANNINYATNILRLN